MPVEKERKNLKDFVESEIVKGNYVGRAEMLEFDSKNNNFLRNLGVDKLDKEIRGVLGDVEYVKCNNCFQYEGEFICSKMKQTIGTFLNGVSNLRKECKGNHAYFTDCTRIPRN